MKNAIYISMGIIFSLLVFSCHPNDVASTEDMEEMNGNIQNYNTFSAKADSTTYKDTDPPKDRDHWRPVENYNERK
ncbi:hypothetical protein J2786_003596 [Chryseobacterium vietnamense]|uniref:Uncharacterized protein n=1 Tax=Chryseobacterium vietnamense TaxID=866785 RepID=A0ACC6JCF1_9FLAO|nr:hypothetical protein [Chryseobacterium vietnamense]MDR6460462.1 hypothetical protein [Chryseobacterium vietnamense]